jgi:predicted metalloendopeptidase
MITRYNGGFNAAQRAFVGGLINPSNRELNNLAATICGERITNTRDPNLPSARFAQLARLVLVSTNNKAGDSEALSAMLEQGFYQLPDASFAKTGLERNEATRATYTDLCARLMEQVQAMAQAPAQAR